MRRGTILPASEGVTYNAWGHPMIAYDDGSWQRFCSTFDFSSWATFASEDKCRVLLDVPGINNGEVDARSLSGNRIAISERSFGGTSLFTRAIVAELRIRVWEDLDLDPRREILKLSFSQKKTGNVVTGMDDFAVALSPDGRLLAVLIDSTLMLYSI
jgi:hypothetical protein